jgi:all-trans-retinol dehydrogenase (NAD+)
MHRWLQAQQVLESVGPVTILVNNAGVVFGRKLMDSRDEDIVMAMRTNTLAHIWVRIVPYYKWL